MNDSLEVKKWRWFFQILILIGIFFLYIDHHPTYFQSGDSPELVARAFTLTVPHPPGFPLYVWLTHPILKLSTPENLYSVASIVNIVISMMTLLLLMRLKSGLWLVLSLALSRYFWMYSEIPEVFALNAFLTALVLVLFVERNATPFMRNWAGVLTIFAFCVGLGNHHTLLFVAPAVLWFLWDGRRKTRIWMSLALGILVFLGLYFSLELMHPDHILSWGKITNFKALLHHFLRRDFGTFALQGGEEKPELLTNLGFFLREVVLEIPAVLIIIGGGLLTLKKRGERLSLESKIIGISLFFYIAVFFALANMKMTGGFLEFLLHRFTIMPFVILSIFASTFPMILDWPVRKSIKSVVGAAIVVLLVLGFAKNNKENDLSKNSVIQDFVVNFLRMANDHFTVAMISADTVYFGVQYAQHVLGVRPDILLILPTVSTLPDFREKINEQYKPFEMPALYGPLSQIRELAEIVLPNLRHADFLVDGFYHDTDKFHLSVRAVGQILSQGKGVDFDQESFQKIVRHNYTGPLDYDDKDFHEDQQWEWNYVGYYFIKASIEKEDGKLEEAKKTILQGLKVVPYCGYCVSLYCEMDPSVPFCAKVKTVPGSGSQPDSK